MDTVLTRCPPSSKQLHTAARAALRQLLQTEESWLNAAAATDNCQAAPDAADTEWTIPAAQHYPEVRPYSSPRSQHDSSPTEAADAGSGREESGHLGANFRPKSGGPPHHRPRSKGAASEAGLIDSTIETDRLLMETLRSKRGRFSPSRAVASRPVSAAQLATPAHGDMLQNRNAQAGPGARRRPESAPDGAPRPAKPSAPTSAAASGRSARHPSRRTVSGKHGCVSYTSYKCVWAWSKLQLDGTPIGRLAAHSMTSICTAL